MININLNSEVPIYIQLKYEIIKEIASGELSDGDSLPTIRELASDLGVNLHTVNKAYNLLKDEGYVSISRRNGVLINIGKRNETLEKITKEMFILIQEATCKNIGKEEVIRLIEEIYDNAELKTYW